MWFISSVIAEPQETKVDPEPTSSAVPAEKLKIEEDKVKDVEAGINQMKIKKATENVIPKGAEGIPLRLHKGKELKKSEKFMSTKEVEQKVC